MNRKRSMVTDDTGRTPKITETGGTAPYTS